MPTKSFVSSATIIYNKFGILHLHGTAALEDLDLVLDAVLGPHAKRVLPDALGHVGVFDLNNARRERER